MEKKPMTNIEFIEQFHEKLKGLPKPIKEVFINFCRLSEGILDVNYIKHVLPAFIKRDAQQVWIKLLSLDSEKIKNAIIPHFTIEMRAQKIAQAILHMENHIEHVFCQYNFCQLRIKSRRNIQNQIESLIESVENSMLLTPWERPRITNDPFLNYLKNEQKTRNIENQKLEEQLGDLEKFNTEFIHVTRETRKTDNSKGRGESKAYTYFLHTAFKQLYGKPYLKEISILLDALFNQTYEENDISAMASSLKKFRTEHSSPLHNMFEIFLSSAVINNGLGLWQTTSTLSE